MGGQAGRRGGPSADQSGIFVSYRRDDTAGFAGRLYDDLVERLPRARIFMDIDAIQPGEDFVDAIQRAVGHSGVVLALIGPRWLEAADASGARRIDNELDYVRLEIEGGLRAGKRVIPVLVQGASMPRAADLPESLRPLARRQAVELSHARWRSDVLTLVEAILAPESRGEPPGQRTPAHRPVDPSTRAGRLSSIPVATLAAGLLVLVALIAGGTYVGTLVTAQASASASGTGAGDPSNAATLAPSFGVGQPPDGPSGAPTAPSASGMASPSASPASSPAASPTRTSRPPTAAPATKPPATKKPPAPTAPPGPTPTPDNRPISAFGVPCTIWGTSGSDEGSGIQGTSGDDVICGLGGNDLIVGNGGADRIDGGGGTDRVTYSNASGGVTVNLATGVVSGAAGADRLISIEGVMDSTHDDVLTGTGGSDYFWLHGGADTVTGGAGTDAVDYTYAPAGECANDALSGIEERYPDGACS